MTKQAAVPDVTALTFLFKGFLVKWFPDPCTGDDLVFRETLVKCWNELLVRLEQTHDKLGTQDLEVLAFCIRRIYFIAEAYTAENKTYTVAQWTTKLIDTLKSAGIQGLSGLI